MTEQMMKKIGDTPAANYGASQKANSNLESYPSEERKKKVYLTTFSDHAGSFHEETFDSIEHH